MHEPDVTGEPKGKYTRHLCRHHFKLYPCYINNDPNLLPNVKLVMRWNDTKGETVEATKAMIDMICEGVAAFFGPEGNCYVEAIGVKKGLYRLKAEGELFKV
ncbi:Similar to Gyc76C: Receptor-type guanylate cyclase Gyc76C (Drosophila melanogaster) [Cotesia congregata]|uniref:Similar to Gyc76C: Receptor-type guanylate cyclase Gyc76C (Drosophila melanogaster) n=1 Tax=Cotesia congregata TaxID=51543 RepID=A0A8J2H944_COTCN|nr:Similar to Gyc76C: Receptor-type guanylate cyclase Gyc76C (Drosophila melanogaster) [Cotesia congregata]